MCAVIHGDGAAVTLPPEWYHDPVVFQREGAVNTSRAIVGEDRRICEAVQRNLEAGVYRSGWLSARHETGVAAFQDWVRAASDADATTS